MEEERKSSLRIFADCDALPRPLKEILLKVAEREKVDVWMVAANAPRVPYSVYVKAVGAGNAFNGADDWIAARVGPGDLVITADIPLAARCLESGAGVLGVKGTFFTQANIQNALAMRELMDELRVSGEITGGPPPFSDRQRVLFINALNRFLHGKRPLA